MLLLYKWPDPFFDHLNDPALFSQNLPIPRVCNWYPKQFSQIEINIPVKGSVIGANSLEKTCKCIYKTSKGTNQLILGL